MKQALTFVAINFLSNGLRVGISFLQTLLVARWLGIEDFGYASLFTSYVTFLHYFFLMGYNQTIPYFLAQLASATAKSRFRVLQNAVWTSSLLAFLTLTILTVLLTKKFIPGIKNEHLWPILILGWQMWPSSVSYVTTGYLNGQKNFSYAIAKEQFLFPIVLLLSSYLYIYILQWGILGYAFTHLTASVISLLFGFYASWVIYNKDDSKESMQSSNETFLPLKDQLQYTWPVGIVSSFEPLFQYSFIVVAGFLILPRDIGYLAVSFRMSFLVLMLLAAAGPIVAPYISDYYQKKQNELLGNIYSKLNFVTTVFSLTVLFFILLFQGELLTLFKADSEISRTIFKIICLGLVFEGSLGNTKLTIVATGKSKTNLYNQMIIVPLSVLASYYLGLQHGALGISISFAATYFLLNITRVCELYWIHRLLPYNLRDLGKLGILIFVLILSQALIKSVELTLIYKLLLAILVTVPTLMLIAKEDVLWLLQKRKLKQSV